MMQVLILLGSHSDLPITESGVEKLKELGISFSLRIASAHRTPDIVHDLVKDFEKEGQVIMCVAGKSAHLAGVVAALTLKPVIAVPVFSQATAGFDSLLSMSQMPKGIPVATMGFGSSGFSNGVLLACQIMALSQENLQKKLQADRKSMATAVVDADQKHRIDFTA